jgi:hypothetical protein
MDDVVQREVQRINKKPNGRVYERGRLGKVNIWAALDSMESRLGLRVSEGDDANLSQMLENLSSVQRNYVSRSKMRPGYRMGARSRDAEPIQRTFATPRDVASQDMKRRELVEKVEKRAAALQRHYDDRDDALHFNLSLTEELEWSVEEMNAIKAERMKAIETCVSNAITDAHPRIVTSMMQLESSFQKLARRLYETKVIVKLRADANEAYESLQRNQKKNAQS